MDEPQLPEIGDQNPDHLHAALLALVESCLWCGSTNLDIITDAPGAEGLSRVHCTSCGYVHSVGDVAYIAACSPTVCDKRHWLEKKTRLQWMTNKNNQPRPWLR